MAMKDRGFFPQGSNIYVPAMQFTTGLANAQPTQFSLGSPAAPSANAIGNAIAGNSAPGTIATLTAWLADSTYGRVTRVTPSGDPGAAGGVWDLWGWDYLGQRMVERFSGANGSTAIMYGKKAFY